VKIKFVILTCKKCENRRKAVISTWGRGFELSFLSDLQVKNENPCIHTLSYPNDDPHFLGKRYFSFFQDQSNLDPSCDYYFFCDDDTFVFTDKLYNLAGNFKQDSPIALGWKYDFAPGPGDDKIYGRFEGLPLPFLSGGAGILMNRFGVRLIFEYMKQEPNPGYNKHTDTSLGFWMRRMDVKLIHCDGTLNPSCPSSEFAKHYPMLPIEQVITYHNVPTEKFEELIKLQE
jgi:hypothetical protein